MLALTGQKFGKLPSRLLGILDDVMALEFDQAAAWRLQRWEDERMAAMWGSKEEDDNKVTFHSVPVR